MNNTPFLIRDAQPADVPELFAMLSELAEFEKLSHQLIATPEEMHAALFEDSRGGVEALVAEGPNDDQQNVDSPSLVGYAIFFQNFSTFLCKRGIYLEDIYVRPAHRKRGVGKSFLQRLAQIAIARDCGRMEWAVLDWNQMRSTSMKPSAEMSCRTGESFV